MIPKGLLTNFIGRLPEQKIRELDQALKIALDIFD
jgi:mRNA-degrading endonuclease toxin of MazEF toxin-antitoxin module